MKIEISNFKYQTKTDTQLKSDFKRRLKAGKNGFFSFDDFKKCKPKF